jgi:hypothetical protein
MYYDRSFRLKLDAVFNFDEMLQGVNKDVKKDY